MGISEPGSLQFLIIGTARSGTTLVQRLCAELPGVWVPPETHFWDLADRARYRFEFPLRGRTRAEFVDWMMSELRDRNLGLDPGDVIEDLRTRQVRIGLWQVFEATVIAMSPNSEVLGEKTPNHIAWWEHFAAARPDLKYLAVVRDPRAVLRSQRSVAWGERDPYALAERWLAHQRSIRDCRRMLGPERCMVIRYEDLVADTPRHHEQIAGFLGVPFEPHELTRRRLKRYPLFPERESWKQNATGAVTGDRVDRWRESLTDEDVAIIQATCVDEMTAFGYSLDDAPPAPPAEPDSLERVQAFRHWYRSVAALDTLPIN
jgi:hypothetical protein